MTMIIMIILIIIIIIIIIINNNNNNNIKLCLHSPVSVFSMALYNTLPDLS